MFEKILQRIQQRMQSHAYILTIHADEEMDNDGLRIGDIEHVIRTGHIIERQQDIHGEAWKYLIKGYTQDDLDVIVVAKLSPVDMVVIITVYRMEGEGDGESAFVR